MKSPARLVRPINELSDLLLEDGRDVAELSLEGAGAVSDELDLVRSRGLSAVLVGGVMASRCFRPVKMTQAPSVAAFCTACQQRSKGQEGLVFVLKLIIY